MKVAAIHPHFVVEAPPGAENSEAQRASKELHLKLVRPEAPGEGQETLNQETRDGLKRLTRLIREKKKASSEEQNQSRRREPDERQKRRAFHLYRAIQDARDPRQGRGDKIDEYL